ncbi:LapA family protein [Cylindrospermopsis curvispora GIHE-G1]|uniref:LapA family protein n=2 Tax=Cylindrospermopsis TaxID=77021 RepID=A0A7H0F578_9CYAN|nr:LapA family protein [Cylindrospermopsis curvispora GIHE-G1]
MILLVQNLAPSLPLMFLGMRSRPLPLALWILFSITAGGLTSLLINTFVSTLWKITGYSTTQTGSSAPPSGSKSFDTYNQENTHSVNHPPRSRNGNDDTGDKFDDWQMGSQEGDDWDFTQPPKSPTQRNVSPSDSVYSYSSQSPKNTGVGKAESIYDADYRVIIPPYQPPSTNPSDNDTDDDWDFLTDEE